MKGGQLVEKKIIIIGPEFRDFIFQKNNINSIFIEKLWYQFKKIDSQLAYDSLLQKLITCSKRSHVGNLELLELIRLLQMETSYNAVEEADDRALLYRSLISRCFLVQNNELESSIQLFLGEFIAKQDYVFSYQFDLLLEESVTDRERIKVFTDRHDFLLNNKNEHDIFLYKLYGSMDNIESLALTESEKIDKTINMRIAISKISRYKNSSISVIGFNEGSKEWNDICRELSLKTEIKQISFIRLIDDPESANQTSYKEEKDGLIINTVYSHLRNYLIDQTNFAEKKQKIKLLKVQKNNNATTTQEEIQPEECIPYRNRKHKRKKTSKNAAVRIPYKVIASVCVILFGVMGLNFFFSIAVISGQSMSPSYSSSDYILLNKQYSSINRFDVIAFDSPDEAGQEYIKRVIGLPGDLIEYIDDQLYIDGNLIEESYLDREKSELKAEEVFTKDFSLESLMGVKEVPKDKLFVLGDNRLYSRDSRAFGFIDVKSIKGDVKLKLWPIHIGSESK